MFCARCGHGYLLAHPAAEFDLKSSVAPAPAVNSMLCTDVGNAIEMRDHVILAGRYVGELVFTVFVSVDAAFELQDGNQNVMNWFVGLAECYGAAQGVAVD